MGLFLLIEVLTVAALAFAARRLAAKRLVTRSRLQARRAWAIRELQRLRPHEPVMVSMIIRPTLDETMHHRLEVLKRVWSSWTRGQRVCWSLFAGALVLRLHRWWWWGGEYGQVVEVSAWALFVLAGVASAALALRVRGCLNGLVSDMRSDMR